MIGMDNSCQIYDLARRAKERLKKNNYALSQPIKAPSAKTFSDYVKSRHKDVKNVPVKTIKREEDEMYLRVCNLIKSGQTQNPILSLIDKDFFETLDSEAKQFYISNLTQKFKFLVKRYYKEHI